MTRTFGADPEFFVKDLTTNKFTTIIDKCGGTKKKPLALGNIGTVQEDGVAVELGFKPAKSYKEFITSYNSIRKAAEEHLQSRGLSIVDDVCSVNFEEQDLQHPLAWESGCDPDLDAWLMTRNMPLKYDNTVRYAGGHLHIGVDGMDVDEKVQFVRRLDLFLAIPSVLLDKDYERRRHYGQAGRFRIKPYGIEYRSLSNYWLKDNSLIEWVLKQADKARTSKLNIDDMGERIRSIVYHSDEKDANKLVKEFKLKVA